MACKYRYKGKTFTQPEFEQFLKDNGNIPADQYKQIGYNDMPDNQVKAFTSQLTGLEAAGLLTKNMKDVAEQMMKDSASIVSSITKNSEGKSVLGEYYIDLAGTKKFVRTGDFYQNLDYKLPNSDTIIPKYFKYKGKEKVEGDEDTSENNRQWGNQVDGILDSVLQGDTLENTIKDWIQGLENRKEDNIGGAILSKEVVTELYDIFTNFKNANNHLLLLPQVVFFNNEVNVAGTADIVGIDKDGRIKIIDLKSSIYSVLSDKYTKNYGKDGGSTKERHMAQLSTYKAMAMARGYNFQDFNELTILPIYLTTEDTLVTKATKEQDQTLHAYQFILDMFNKDEMPTDKKNAINRDLATISGKMRKILEDRRVALIRKANVKNKDFKIKELERLQKSIEFTERIKSIEDFVNSTYNILIEAEFYNNKTKTVGHKKGVVVEIDNTIEKVNNGEYTAFEAIDQLMYYKNLVDAYESSIDDIKDFYENYDLGSAVATEGTPLQKIKDIILVGKTIRNKYNKQIMPLIAKILASQSTETITDNAKKEVAAAEKILNDAIRRGESKKYIASLTKQRAILEKYNPENLEKVILAQLQNGSFEDIGIADTWLSPAISSSNAILANFAKTVKKEFEDARLESFDFSHEAATAFEKYKRSAGSSFNSETFNKDFFEEVTNKEGEKVYKFVQRLDENAYNAVYKKHLVDIENIVDKEVLALKWKKFTDENKMPLPDEDYTINGEVMLLGKKSRQNALQEQYAIKAITLGELNFELKELDKIFIPNHNKFRNTAYYNLKGAKKEYYDFLVSSYFKAQRRIPNSVRLWYQLPSVPKKALDRITEGSLKEYLEYSWGQKSVTSEDRDKYGETATTIKNETIESSLKVIPLLYHNKLSPQDVSLDLISSMVLYNDATLKYQAQLKLSSFSEATLDVITTNTPYKTDGFGEQIVDKAAHTLGIPDMYQKYIKKMGADNNLAKLLGIFIDMQIYGKTSIPSTAKLLFTDKEVSADKIVNGIMNFASLTQISANPLLSTVNYLGANISNRIEAASKEFVSDAELTKAKWIYDKETTKGTFIKDFTEPLNRSLIGQLVDVYDALQGNYHDKLGRKISNSTTKKLWSTDSMFFMQHISEHKPQVELMIAYMHRVKVQSPSGMIPLYEAYELGKDGKIKLKNGIVLSGQISKNGLVSYDVQNTLHAMNKRLQGVYNKFDKIALERHWLGRLLTMYKKFLVPGLKRRYKGLSYDYELGSYTEGFYSTFYRKLVADWVGTAKMLLPAAFGGQLENLTPLEQANIRRAVREMGIICMTGALTMLLTAMVKASDDDDEKLALRYPLYLVMKSNVELGVFLGFGDPQNFGLPNIQEMMRYPQNPFAAYSVIKKGSKILFQLTDPTEKYQRDSGLFKKGDNKLAANFIKFWGISGTNFDPENGIKWLELQTN